MERRCIIQHALRIWCLSWSIQPIFWLLFTHAHTFYMTTVLCMFCTNPVLFGLPQVKILDSVREDKTRLGPENPTFTQEMISTKNNVM